MAARKSYPERPSYIYLGGDQRNNSITSDIQFEFDEADVWNSNCNETIVSEHKKSIIPNSRSSRKPAKKSSVRLDRRTIPAAAATSLPVNIPDWSKIIPSEYSRNQRREIEDDSGDDEGGSWLPPHEYLARTRTASFSVHEGIGRTLKGRDLSKVRNAIWKQTGFED